MEILVRRIRQAQTLTLDLFEHLSEEALRLDLPGLPSNTMGSQVWCIVGARESYLRALRQGAWAGFRCSLADRYDKSAVVSALRETAAQYQEFLQGERGYSETLLVEALEHEVQHHGQLIRYIYANRLGFPHSWHERYTV